MTYQLAINEEPPAALSRVLQELLMDSRNLLLNPVNSSTEKAVHETRKNMKRARAALRLLRPHIQADVFDLWNHKFRDVGRAISETRDRRVILLAVDKLLKSEMKSPSKTRALQTFQRTLRDISNHALHSTAESVGTARMKIDELLTLMPVFPILTKSTSGYKKGFQASLRATAKAMKKCGKNPNPEKVHQLRKRTKDLLYQTQMLQPREAKALKQLDRLSDWLGNHHDLAMVAEKADSCVLQDLLSAEDARTIHHLLARKQRRLWEKARSHRNGFP